MNNPIPIHRTLRNCHRLPRLWLAGLLAVMGAGLTARAAIILDLPNLTLQPNQANQSFTISIQNTDGSALSTINGVALQLVIGTYPAAGVQPTFQAVSLLGGVNLFASNNTGDNGPGDIGGTGQVFLRNTSTASGTVTLNPGTFALATVTFSTSGVGAGNYSWSAATSPNGQSYYSTTNNSQVFPTLIDGSLTVVPEPVNVALPVFGGLAVLIGGLRRWCRRQAGAC